MNIKIETQKVLESFGWQDHSENGLLVYKKTKSDFTKIQEISLNRVGEDCHLEWKETSLKDLNQKILFSFKSHQGIIVESTPNLVEQSHFDALLNQVKNMTALMNTTPTFLFTGKIKHPTVQPKNDGKTL